MVTCSEANHFCSLDEDEIDDRCDGLRKKLEEERKAGKGAGPDARSLKSHQVHDLAQVSDTQRRSGEVTCSHGS